MSSYKNNYTTSAALSQQDNHAQDQDTSPSLKDNPAPKQGISSSLKDDPAPKQGISPSLEDNPAPDHDTALSQQNVLHITSGQRRQRRNLSEVSLFLSYWRAQFAMQSNGNY